MSAPRAQQPSPEESVPAGPVPQPDQRLRDLTEHCLRLLDDLARARQEVRDRGQLQARIARLEEALADARARVRVAGSAVLGTPSPSPAPWELMIWGLDRAGLRRLPKLLEPLTDVSVGVLLGAGQRAARLKLPAGERLSVLESDCELPAQFWNLAMAGSQADAVVCLWGGARFESESLAQLAAAAVEGVALAGPMVRSGRSRRWLGLAEQGPLELEPALAGKRGEATAPVAFLSPEAFVVRRQAFHQLGAFDQDLRSSLALAEYCLRTHGTDLRLVALRDVEIAVTRALPHEERRHGLDTQDRIIALARHRPEQFASALIASDLPWTLSPDALSDLMRACVARLTQEQAPRAAADALVGQLLQFAQRAVPERVLRGHLESMEEVLQVTLGVGEERYSDRLRQAVEGARSSLHAKQQALGQQLQRLQAEVAAEETAKRELEQALAQREREVAALRATVAELQQDLARHAHTIREHKDELIARAGAVDALKDRLAQREAAVHEVEQQRQHLAGQAEATAAELRQARAANAELSAALARVQVEAASLAAVQAELQRRASADDEAARDRLRQATARCEELESTSARQAKALADLRTASEAEADQLADHLHRAETQLQRVEADLRRRQDEADRLGARLRDVLGVVAEREKWIVALLREVAGRRFTPFPRQLQAHERAFLDGRGAGAP